jgi:uncharacterized membrane protein YvbJ
MFCPQCGANNADTAAVCTQCGRSLQPAAPAPLSVLGVVQPPLQPVENYLVFAILATVLCCLPTGIVAIIYAAQVNGKLQIGDLAGAKAASDNAKMWCWISFGLGLAVTVVSVMLMMLGVVSGLHQR